jgi:hypothetical protein
MRDYIEVDGKRWNIPEWATEETLNKIKDFSEDMVGLLQVMTVGSARDNKSAKEVLKEYKKNNKLSEKSLTEDQKIAKAIGNLNKINDDGRKDNNKHFQRLGNNLRDFSHNIERHTYTLSELITNNLSDLGRNIGDMLGSVTTAFASPIFGKAVGAGLGSVVGMTVGFVFQTLDTYSKSLLQLSDIGASFGISLMDLRNSAQLAGMNMEDFSSLISQNSQALRGLGNNASESMMMFAKISESVLTMSEDFNYFGMNISDLNEAIMQEIEIRRKSGLLVSQNNADLADSMKDLFFQTSAVASLTGQNRRDMLRSRQEMVSDPVISAFLTTLDEPQQEAFKNTISMVTGLFGEELTRGFQSSIVTGRELESFVGPQMAFLEQIFGGDFREIISVLRDDIMAGASSEDISNRFLSLISQLTENEDNLQTLINVALAEGPMSAEAQRALATSANLRGLTERNLTPQDIARMTEEEITKLMSQSAAAIPAEQERAMNAVRASLLETFDNMLQIDDAGGGLVTALETIRSSFTDADGNVRPFEEGMGDILSMLGEEVIQTLTQIDMLDVLNKIYDLWKETGPIGKTIIAISIALAAIRAASLVGSTASVLSNLAKNDVTRNVTRRVASFLVRRAGPLAPFIVPTTMGDGTLTDNPNIYEGLTQEMVDTDMSPQQQAELERNKLKIDHLTAVIQARLDKIDIQNEEQVLDLVRSGQQVPETMLNQITDRSLLTSIQRMNQLLYSINESINQGNRANVRAIEEYSTN